MNLGSLINRIRLELGHYIISLPLDDIDGTIADIIKNITLRTYSQYFPTFDRVDISYHDLVKGCVDGRDYMEILLDVPEGVEIVYISRVEPHSDHGYTFGGYGIARGLGPSIYTPLQDLLLTSAAASLQQATTPGIKWDFKYPRTLLIYNSYYGDLWVEYARLHDPNLSSIPFSQEETFTNLAILDVKKTLYNTVKHYNELESVHGRISLKIDDWADADNGRKEILREWDDTYHLEARTVYFA